MSLCKVTLYGGAAIEPKRMALFPGSERLSPKMESPLMGAAWIARANRRPRSAAATMGIIRGCIQAGHILHACYRTARTPGIDRSNALVVQLSPSETLNTIMAFDVACIDETRSKYCVHTTKG